jgi:adenylate cyclase
MSDGGKQRLAAILAADGAGYSRLMEVDERATMAALDAARSVFKAQIEANHGRVINMAGDSVLALFDTAAGAVTAALEAQERLDAASAGTPENMRLRFRVGVHLGDVIENADGDVHGDGVNIAARLQSIAVPGGVAVSDAVRGAVKSRVAAKFENMGAQRVKNIADPVHAFAVVAAARSDTASGQRPSHLTRRAAWLVGVAVLASLWVLPGNISRPHPRRRLPT